MEFIPVCIHCKPKHTNDQYFSMNISDFFKGTIILEEVVSPVNGKISVVRSLGLGTYFQVGDLTQSGGIVYEIWKTTLKKVKSIITQPNNILVLGLGGGNCAKLSRKLWPYAHITGVDFDETIVNLGKKYLDLGKVGAEIIVSDAFEFIEKAAQAKKEFDLIIVDLYVGQEFPVVFESEAFLNNLGKILSNSGLTVFNRLYFAEKRSQTVKFGNRLEKIFPKVEYFYPEANVMILCRK